MTPYRNPTVLRAVLSVRSKTAAFLTQKMKLTKMTMSEVCETVDAMFVSYERLHLSGEYESRIPSFPE